MCIVAAAVPWILAGVSAAVTIAGGISANHAAKKQANAINEQSAIQAEEISDQKGVELDERARAARRERAAARVAASESGINLGSNSFLAMLQTSEINQSIDSGLILKGEKTEQRARQAETNSYLAGIHMKSGLGIALDATQAGVQGYFGGGGNPYLGKKPGKG
jgi:hypothetical protein